MKFSCTDFSAVYTDRGRLTKMLEIIHEHYGEKLTLRDIARAANIGERECLRCFQRTIQISPIQYLLKYRVMQGASMLLQVPQKSIAQISCDCGFESPGHFTKMFKRYFACTPKEYRCMGTEIAI